MNIRPFLNQCRSSMIEVASLSQLNLVLGNEAADADSIVSSVSYAFLKSQQQGELCKINIPVACIPKKDMNLRRDVAILFDMAGMDASEVICIDEIPLTTYSSNKDLTISLVDHNVISHSLSEYGSKVNEIIDHHVDMDEYAWVVDSRRNIAFDPIKGFPTAGSTCTLITEAYMKENPKLIDIHIATLLLGVILLDTLNMIPSFERGTNRDLQAIQTLTTMHPSLDRERMFNILKDAKNDPIYWESLSAEDSLRIDFKSFQISFPPNLSSSSSILSSTGIQKSPYNIGISSILLPINSLFNKSDLIESIKTYLINKQMKIFSVMSFIASPQPSRELIIFSKDESLLQQLDSFLLNNCLDLKLVKMDREFINDDGILCLIYEQKNIKMSRKQVRLKDLSLTSGELEGLYSSSKRVASLTVVPLEFLVSAYVLQCRTTSKKFIDLKDLGLFGYKREERLESAFTVSNIYKSSRCTDNYVQTECNAIMQHSFMKSTVKIDRQHFDSSCAFSQHLDKTLHKKK
eukprot:gene8412-17333_t